MSRDQLAGRRDNVIGWLEMTICFVKWSVNHVTNFGEKPPLDAFPYTTVNASLLVDWCLYQYAGGGLQELKTAITVDESAKNVLPTFFIGHVINFVTGRWEHVTSFVKARDWLTGYDVRGRVLFCWPAGCCFKSREAWTSALCRWNSWPDLSRFFFTAGCTLKPVSWPSTALTTDTRAGSIRVGLRVCSEEIWRIHLLLLMKKHWS